MDSRERGRRSLAAATVGVGALAVAGAAGVGLTRPTPSHAATRTPSTRSHHDQGFTQDDQAQQQQGFAPQPGFGPADAGSSGS
jgi:hypothetical protein